MLERATELERFKTEIDLRDYAGSVGYDLDLKRSARSGSSAVMRHGNGDKVVIARLPNKHWVYFSIHDEADNGTIIDFVQRRQRLDLGAVRQELRPWIGEAPARSPLIKGRFGPPLQVSSKDVAAVQAAFAACEAGSSLYLDRRGINNAVQTGERFVGTIYRDRRGNTIFPHHNRSGICGFEIKNAGFTGFAKGGEKGLWHSRIKPGDDTAVFSETAIDALSYFALAGHPRMRLFSTAGALGPFQPGLIELAAQKLPEGGSVILATDNDAGGDELAEAIRQAAERSGRDDLTVTEDRPLSRGQDWNAVLQEAAARFAPEP